MTAICSKFKSRDSYLIPQLKKKGIINLVKQI